MVITKQFVLFFALVIGVLLIALTYPAAHKTYAGQRVYKLCGGGTFPVPNYSPGAVYNMPCLASDQYVEKNNVAPYYTSIAFTSVILVALIFVQINDRSPAQTKKSSSRKN